MTDLTDAALRERLFAAFQSEAIALVRQKAISREDCSALVSSFARIAAAECVALRDAARVEQQEEIDGLREALGVMGANYDDAVAEGKAAVQRATDVARAEQREADALATCLQCREALQHKGPEVEQRNGGWIHVHGEHDWRSCDAAAIRSQR